MALATDSTTRRNFTLGQLHVTGEAGTLTRITIDGEEINPDRWLPFGPIEFDTKGHREDQCVSFWLRRRPNGQLSIEYVWPSVVRACEGYKSTVILVNGWSKPLADGQTLTEEMPSIFKSTSRLQLEVAARIMILVGICIVTYYLLF